MTFLFLAFSSALHLHAENAADATEWAHGHVRDESGAPIKGAEVAVFDGFKTHAVKTDAQGMYKISEPPVSVDRYAVLFFTKAGYVPEAVNVKVNEDTGVDYSMVLEKTEKKKTGFVIGTVYQPLRGGKIRFQSGIYGFGKKRAVWLERDGKKIVRETDEEGHFLFEVPAGKYVLGREGSRATARVDVSKGQTTIKNIRSGIILVD